MPNLLSTQPVTNKSPLASFPNLTGASLAAPAPTPAPQRSVQAYPSSQSPAVPVQAAPARQASPAQSSALSGNMVNGNIPVEYANQGLLDYVSSLSAPKAQPITLNPLNSNGAVPSTALGGATTKDVLSTRNYLEGLQKSLMTAATPTQSEIDANANLRNVDQQALEARQQSEAEINRLMTTANLTREQAGGFLTETNRRAQNAATQLALQRSAYSNVAANEQAQRQSQTDAYKLLYQMQQPQSVGGSLVNPVTGEVVYQSPQSMTDKYGTGSIGEYNFYAAQERVAGRTPMSYQEYQTADANRKAMAESLTPYQKFQATQSIAKDTQARTESAREMARQAELISSSYNNILNGGDKSLNTQAIVTSFNKILDPSSVVRESEYDRTAQGQSLLAQLQGKVQNIVSGGAGVTQQTLLEAATIANTYLQGARESINAQNQRAIEMANQFGLNSGFVTSTGYQGGQASQQSGGQSGPVTWADL